MELGGFEPAIKTPMGRSSRKFYLLNGMVELRGFEPTVFIGTELLQKF
jgi:hypothetical protein